MLGMFLQVFFYFNTYFAWSAFRRSCRSIHWVRWKTERLFDGKVCQEYLCLKLLRSVNWFSSYSRKCQGYFLRHSVVRHWVYLSSHLMTRPGVEPPPFVSIVSPAPYCYAPKPPVFAMATKNTKQNCDTWIKLLLQTVIKRVRNLCRNVLVRREKLALCYQYSKLVTLLLIDERILFLLTNKLLKLSAFFLRGVRFLVLLRRPSPTRVRAPNPKTKAKKTELGWNVY